MKIKTDDLPDQIHKGIRRIRRIGAAAKENNMLTEIRAMTYVAKSVGNRQEETFISSVLGVKIFIRVTPLR